MPHLFKQTLNLGYVGCAIKEIDILSGTRFTDSLFSKLLSIFSSASHDLSKILGPRILTWFGAWYRSFTHSVMYASLESIAHRASTHFSRDEVNLRHGVEGEQCWIIVRGQV